MRKSFVLFVLVPLVILSIVVYLFIDRWVESGLEAGGEALVGARVEIDNLSVTLFPIGIEWKRIQVANPNDTWKNLFETGKVKFAMDFGQLLRSKYIIETMEVHDLIIGTKRATDGAIPNAKPPAASETGGSSFVSLAKQALEKTVEQTPVFNLDSLKHGINPDSLIKALDITTLKYIDSLKDQTLAASKQWQSSLDDVENSKKRLTEIEANIKSINPSELKGVDKITAAISTVDNSLKGINEIKSTFDARKQSITADIQRVTGSVGGIENIVKKDYQKLLAMAKLPNLSTAGLAQLLVGQEMYKRGISYLSWVDFARTHIKKYQPKPENETPPRLKGQNIHFPMERAYPKFWIKKVLISGGTGQSKDETFIRAKGEILGITNDQAITGSPLTASLEGFEGGGRTFALAAIIDRRKDTPYDEYKASLSGVPLAEFAIGQSGFLPSKVTNASMASSLSIAVPGDHFDARAHLDLRNVKLQFEAEPKNTLERLVRDVLAPVSAFDVDLRLWNTSGTMDVALSTNLADQLASRVKDVVGAEFTKLQNDLRAKLDNVVNAKKQELEKLVASKKAAVEQQLQTFQTLLNEKLATVEAKKKELTDKLAGESKGKVDDVLKKLIK